MDPNKTKIEILPQLIENCSEDRSFSVTKGQQMCDFCFIEDAVKAIFKTFTSKKSKGGDNKYWIW